MAPEEARRARRGRPDGVLWPQPSCHRRGRLMPRPRDENGVTLPMAHKRLNMTPYHQAALFAMERDGRASALPFNRKIAMIDKAVDHVIDGEKAPAWVYAMDTDRPDNRFLHDMWRIATREVGRVKVVQQAGDHV